MDCKEINKEVDDVILFMITTHQQYLTVEVVPFAFFSKHICSAVKQDMAAKLLEVQYPRILVLVS